MKKSVLSTAILSAIVLSGCGGSSDSGDESGSVQGRTITVIDGYLENAQVCVDRNENGVCDDGEVIGKTNSNGQFTIPVSDKDYPVIIRSIAGSTKDADRVGYLTKSYEMTADSSSNLVTPFTTLADANGISVEDLAKDLNLDSSVISGDYVSLKSDADKAEDAIKAHALARSLVQELPTEATNINGSEMKQTASDINGAIDEHYGNTGDINEIDNNDFVLADDGKFEVVAVINDLQSYLIKGNVDKDSPTSKWTLANFSKYWAAEEGVFDAWLTTDSLCVEEGGQIECMNYRINGDVLSIPSEDGKEENNAFIYTSTDLAFAVPDEGDLTLWTTNDLTTSMNFSQTDFENKTLFTVMDDSDTSASEPVYGEFRFGKFDENTQTGEVTLIEDGEEYPTTWSLPNGNLRIEFDQQAGDNPLVIRYATTNGEIMIVNDVDQHADVYAMMTQDEALALNIVAKWENASK